MKKSTVILVLFASLMAIGLRLLASPTLNFSALGALAVLCGAVARPYWVGLLIPLACRLVTDGILEYRTGHGFYDSMAFDYAAYAAIFCLGGVMQPKRIDVAFGTGAIAAVVFFLVSNFGVWCMPHGGQYLYPQTVAGLRECYMMGLPFAKGTLIGDVMFTGAFLGLLQLVEAKVSAPEPELNES